MSKKAKYSKYDTKGKLYVDCSECERGGNGAGSWAANPWVWVVEFRRVEA